MRLIDVDKIPGAFLITAIAEAPTVDAVPVIRCKDCKFFKPQFNEDGYYTTNCQFSKVAEVNGFCHIARRKEE